MIDVELPGCPSNVYEQVRSFVLNVEELLGGNLRGVYLHGSLAFGCFNPELSDVDLLILTHRPLLLEAKHGLAEGLLARSGNPQSVELSVLNSLQLNPWRHPAPFDFHFSEDHRERMMDDLDSGAWKRWNDEEKCDPDLAAHFTVTLRRGIVLSGEPISESIPSVPLKDFRDSILEDLHWARERFMDLPVYAVLNSCRGCAAIEEDLVLSKLEGADWALGKFPEQFHALISSALDAYQGRSNPEFDAVSVPVLMQYVLDRIKGVSERAEQVPIRCSCYCGSFKC
jgi:predicted nucleotidyltransferase